MKIVGIIQARMTSTRLPGKILADLCGKPMLLQTVERISRSKYINKVIIATSVMPEDDVVEKFTQQYQINLFRGSLSDVLERFYLCALEEKADIIVRFTGDNPLIDSSLIDEGIDYFMANKDLDYIKYREGLPLGMAVEIFKYNALEKSYKEATDQECREHVTPYIYRNESLFKSHICEKQDSDYSKLRWTVDTEDDYKLINSIYQSLYPTNSNFGYLDVIEKYKEHPEWNQINNQITQKQVLYKGK